MAYSINYNDDENGIITIFSGEVDGKEIVQSNEEKFSDTERVKNLRYILSDYTHVTKYNVTSDDIRTLGEMAENISKQNNTIYLVGIQPTDLMRGMSRMWQAYADDGETGWNTITCRTRKEGETWLLENLDDTLTFDRE